MKAGLLPKSRYGGRIRCSECEACYVIHGHHMCVAGLAGGDAHFSDELPWARPDRITGVRSDNLCQVPTPVPGATNVEIPAGNLINVAPNFPAYRPAAPDPWPPFVIGSR